MQKYAFCLFQGEQQEKVPTLMGLDAVPAQMYAVTSSVKCFAGSVFHDKLNEFGRKGN